MIPNHVSTGPVLCVLQFTFGVPTIRMSGDSLSYYFWLIWLKECIFFPILLNRNTKQWLLKLHFTQVFCYLDNELFCVCQCVCSTNWLYSTLTLQHLHLTCLETESRGVHMFTCKFSHYGSLCVKNDAISTTIYAHFLMTNQNHSYWTLQRAPSLD